MTSIIDKALNEIESNFVYLKDPNFLQLKIRKK
jgi:hypothetical protein